MEEELGQYYDEEMPTPEIRNTGVLYEQYLYSFYRDRGLIPHGFIPPKMGGHGIDLKLLLTNYNINRAVRKRAKRPWRPAYRVVVAAKAARSCLLYTSTSPRGS